MNVREVLIADIWDRALPLMRAHWEEVGFEWAFEFKPSLRRYNAMQEAGVCFCLAAFDPADNLIGYSTAVMSRHAFNDEMLMCISDALYMKHEYRGSVIAGRLMLATERAAKARGATVHCWHTGQEHADMLEQHGYRPADYIVMKGL